MSTPTKYQFQTVIDNLNRVAKDYKVTRKSSFDMGQGRTSDEHGNICNTPHCIAGWYAIATLAPFERCIDFRHGANRMAADLGFGDTPDLKRWAMNNPNVWGNRYGEYMFADSIAYNNAKTLKQAIKFLEKVRDRLPL